MSGTYFAVDAPIEHSEGGTYADLDAPTEHNTTGEWRHPLGEVVSALARRGLSIDFLHERPYTPFPRWPRLLEVHPDGSYRFPPGHPDLPLLYSLGATAA